MAESLHVGLVGLGRMGFGIAERLLSGGHAVTAFDPDAGARERAERAGAAVVASLAELPAALEPPRLLWLMVPAGQPVDDVLFDGPGAVAAGLEPGDVVIDGGNSHYRDSMRRAERLEGQTGAVLLDCGTSGGVEGARVGYCLMVGGPEEAYRRCEPALAAVAAPDGYARVGPRGSGHFVKMVHNAVEYGILQVMGEGASLLEASEFPLELGRIAELWTHGSVIRSWLMELLHRALEREGHFERIAAKVGGGQTGTWAVKAAEELGVSVPAIARSLAERKDSPSNPFAARIVAALRYEFGGHAFETRSE